MAIGVVDILGGIVILDNLVLDNAHACLLDSHLCERYSRLVGRRGSCKEYLIDLLLSELCELALSSLDSGKSSLERFYAVNNSSV